MNFKYYMYLVVCWITHPFRLLMPGYSNFEFAIRYLFSNDWVRCWVYSQSMFETANHTSNRCLTTKNYFNIGKSKLQEYQSGSSAYTGSSPNEPSLFASYKSVYQSVYDYYDWVYNPKRRMVISSQIGLNQTLLSDVPLSLVPKESFSPSEPYFKGLLVQYFNNCGIAFKSAAFYVAPVTTYVSGVYSRSASFTASNWRYFLNYLYTFLFLVILYLYTIDNEHTRKAKSKIRAFKAKF